MKRCPQCRARLKNMGNCRRCGAELEILYAIEASADTWCRLALQSLAARETRNAAVQASTACHLHATPFHRALAGFLEKTAKRE